MASSSVASRWRELQGENKWAGLLEPFDLDLRNELIRYAEFEQAVHDGIDSGDESKFQYYSNYGKSTLFSKVGLGDTKKYDITRYLYSTEKTGFLQIVFGPTSSVWMGYIAVSNDEMTQKIGRRDIVVVFRGTIRNIEWIFDTRFALVPFPKLDGSTHDVPLVHKGFLGMYNESNPESEFGKRSMRQQVMDELKRLIALYKDEELSITVVGHSLGGALSTLCSYDIANSKVNSKGPEEHHSSFLPVKILPTASATIPVTAFLFAAPKVGGEDFKKRAESLVPMLRISDRRDIVPLLPPPSAVYRVAGVEFFVDGSQSTYVKFANFWELFKPHNLEGYLHTLAGLHEIYKVPQSVVEKVLTVPLKLVENVTTKVVSTAGTVATTVSGAVATVIPLPIDDIVEKVIGNDPKGLEVFSKLKQLFFDDLGTLQDFLLRVIRITPADMGSAKFQLVIKRDIALANKSADLLKEEYEIPKEWWVQGNKGMQLQEKDRVWLPRHKRPQDNPAISNADFV